MFRKIAKGIVVRSAATGKLLLVTKGEGSYLNMVDPYDTSGTKSRITPSGLDAALEGGCLEFCWTVEEAEKW